MPKRRRGYQPPGPPRSRKTATSGFRRSGLRAATHQSFEALVERALASIPMPFAQALEEVAIVIADEPTRDELAESGLDPDEALYGLYEGTPRTEWGADWAPFPNRITLYRLSLEEDFPDPRDLADEVRETVIHELAHHLGIDDERLGELGHE
jgi:predicted Zn-dependent protease with MMP-like domain